MGFQRSKSDKANKSCKSGRADKLSELSALGKLVKHEIKLAILGEKLLIDHVSGALGKFGKHSGRLDQWSSVG